MGSATSGRSGRRERDGSPATPPPATPAPRGDSTSRPMRHRHAAGHATPAWIRNRDTAAPCAHAASSAEKRSAPAAQTIPPQPAPRPQPPRLRPKAKGRTGNSLGIVPSRDWDSNSESVAGYPQLRRIPSPAALPPTAERDSGSCSRTKREERNRHAADPLAPARELCAKRGRHP